MFSIVDLVSLSLLYDLIKHSTVLLLSAKNISIKNEKKQTKKLASRSVPSLGNGIVVSNIFVPKIVHAARGI